MIEFSEFAKMAKDKFGMTVTKEMFSSDLYVENMRLYVMTAGSDESQSFDFADETVDGDITTVTVQHYADCNKFIKSYKIAYKTDSGERLISSEIIEGSPYRPYGLRSVK